MTIITADLVRVNLETMGEPGSGLEAADHVLKNKLQVSSVC